MTDAKKKSIRSPKKLRADTDFGYLSDLSPKQRRAAAFYEYARESVELREIVSAMQQAKIFESKGWDASTAGLRPTPAELLAILPLHHLLILYDCRGFPEKPFRDARHDLDPKYFNSFGVEPVGAIPWQALVSLRSGAAASLGLSELEYWTKFWGSCDVRGRTLNAISISWNYTNAELTKSFAPLLRRIRPPEFPEPRQAGRKGRRSSSGATDILNQLIAFRLRRAGLSFDQARVWAPNLMVYTSERGWNKAAAAAEDRIRHMLVPPLFSF